MARKILIADLLCGAGGTTTGAMKALLALGFTRAEIVFVCLNHWGVAIETHRKNHPYARHYLEDIAAARPHLIVPEGYLDLLMASPTCTHHSAARGGKPTSDQQRSDPWHIITWLTELRVKRLLIENVPEFVGWGPVDPKDGRPIKARKGEYFKAWTDTMRRLGFELDWKILNAADFGDATTRRRFFLEARSDGRKLAWPAATHMKRGGSELALFPGMKPWRPAREIIDWGIKGKSIFGRKKDLSPKTLARIYAGAVKFHWPEPFLVILRNHMAGQSVDQPVPTIAANGTHIGLVEPIGAEPVMINGRRNNQPKAVSTEPVPTLDTKGGVWLAEPMVMATGAGAARSVDDPMPTITTGGAGSGDPGCARPMLVEPFVLSAAHGNEAHERDPNGRRVKSIDEPIGAVHAGGGNFAVVEPSFVLSRQAEGAPRSIDEPTPSQVAKHSHVLISPYYGSGSGETCKSADQPLDTVTAKARFGMVVPVTNSTGGPGPRELDDPLPTMTTAKGGEFAMVTPVTHEGGHDRAQDLETPLPTVTGANRGELAFITASFGERPGQAPRVHDIAEPAPTIAATGHINLAMVELTEGHDILFRMLEPHELAAAMGFSNDDIAYEFAGTKTEKIKQIGNAVPVNTACALVGAIMGDAAPKRRAVKIPKLRAAE